MSQLPSPGPDEVQLELLAVPRLSVWTSLTTWRLATPTVAQAWTVFSSGRRL
jgi:hypothetical protein